MRQDLDARSDGHMQQCPPAAIAGSPTSLTVLIIAAASQVLLAVKAISVSSSSSQTQDYGNPFPQSTSNRWAVALNKFSPVRFAGRPAIHEPYREHLMIVISFHLYQMIRALQNDAYLSFRSEYLFL